MQTTQGQLIERPVYASELARQETNTKHLDAQSIGEGSENSFRPRGRLCVCPDTLHTLTRTIAVHLAPEIVVHAEIPTGTMSHCPHVYALLECQISLRAVVAIIEVANRA
jgi:hypothetical protein